MTNPYVVSGPVWGEQFYGRKSLIADITGGVYRALFVMGTRQIGKTSLLRQLNTLAPALCLDLQLVGGSPDKLTHLVRQELRRKRERFPWLPQAEAVDGEDLFGILEMADDAADSAGATLLLLVDEDCPERPHVPGATAGTDAAQLRPESGACGRQASGRPGQ